MPFYDINYAYTTNGSANTETSTLWAKTAANQETLSVMGIFVANRFTTAGGMQVRAKYNTGTTASGGTGQTPNPRNARSAPSAQSTWANAGSTITAGTTLVTKLTVGAAQTGGMGGWVPTVPGDAFQMMPNATNPVDLEFTTNASTASVTGDLTVEFVEGTS